MNMSIYTECDVELPIEINTIVNAVADSFFKRFPCPYDVQLTLYVVDDESIREANSSCRGIDKVTDVLSFPNLPFDPGHINDFSMIEEDDPDVFDPETGELIYGEIMICASKVMAQAAEYGHSVEREFAFLTAHSLLHLTGFDHEDDEDRAKMEAMQEEILVEAGYERC